MILTNTLINFRPEHTFRRASLGHSPNLNIPVASPADITLTEDEKYTMYTLKQLKRTFSAYLSSRTRLLFQR